MARAFLRLLTRPHPRLLFFFLLFSLLPSIPFLIPIIPLLFSHALLLLSAQMAFFTKRLTCFYCGRRSPHTGKDPVRKWHCKHCDADNYLDEVRPFPWSVSPEEANSWLCRMARSQTPLSQKQTPMSTAQMPQVRRLNRPISKQPACFARTAFAISTC